VVRVIVRGRGIAKPPLAAIAVSAIVREGTEGTVANPPDATTAPSVMFRGAGAGEETPAIAVRTVLSPPIARISGRAMVRGTIATIATRDPVAEIPVSAMLRGETVLEGPAAVTSLREIVRGMGGPNMLVIPAAYGAGAVRRGG